MKLAAFVAIALLNLPGTDLIRLGQAELGEGLPAGWELRPVSGVPAPNYYIQEEAGQRRLRVEGMGAAAWAYRELDSPIEPATGSLRWSWRVLELPAGTDLQVPAKDDSALRLYVVFGKPGAPTSRARIIFYTWGNTEPEGLSLKSFVSEKFQIVRVAGAMEAGSDWQEQEVAPFEDYRRFWSNDPSPISTIGLMQDTDMTGGTAISELRSLVWEPQ